MADTGLNRDIWDVVYCKLELLDAARLATVDKMTSLSFKRRLHVEQGRLRSAAETCIPLPLIHGMFAVARCGLHKTHLVHSQQLRQVLDGPTWYSVRQAHSGKVLVTASRKVAPDEKVWVKVDHNSMAKREVPIECRLGISPGECVEMNIVWGKCDVKITGTTCPRRAAAFILMLLHSVQSFKSSDAADPVGSLHISRVRVTMPTPSLMTTQDPTCEMISSPGTDSSAMDETKTALKTLFVHILPYLKDMYVHADTPQSVRRKLPPSRVGASRLCKERGAYKPITRLDIHISMATLRARLDQHRCEWC